MKSITSKSRTRDGKQKKFRAAPYFSQGSLTRDRLEAFIWTTVPAEQRPSKLQSTENLPRIYALFRTGKKIGADEVALVGNQMCLEVGLVQPPLQPAGKSLAALPGLLCEELEAGNIRFPVAIHALRVAATVYRLFQVWQMRELGAHVPLQLEPDFVRKWMEYPCEAAHHCERLKELFLRPRVERAAFRQQRKRAQEQLSDCSYPALTTAQIIRALQWLQVLGFIRVIQRYLRVKGWHGIPRYELVACPMQNVPDLLYPTYEDEVRIRTKRARAKGARIKLENARA